MTRARLAWVVPLCLIQTARLALGADEARPRAGTPVMHVSVAGTAAAVSRTSATVHELCARLGLDVVVEAASDESALNPSTSARFEAFVDLRSASGPRVVVVDGETHREIERRVLPSSGSLEMSAEAAAHVLYMTAESALSAHEQRPESKRAVGSAEPPPAPQRVPEEPRATPPSKNLTNTTRADADRTHSGVASDESPQRATHRRETGRRLESELGAFGAASSFGASHAEFGAGASIDAGTRAGALRFSARLSLGAYVPSELTRGGTTASIAAQAGRVVAVGAWDATSAFVPFAGLGGGVDRIVLDANAPPPGASAAGVETRVDPILTSEIGAKIRFSSSLGAFFAFATDVDLAPHRYVVEANGAPETFLDLSRVRPSAFLGMTVSLAGASPPRVGARP